MQIWPGQALPPRRDVRRRRHQLLAVFRGRRARRAVPVRRARRRDAGRPAGEDGALLARLPARASRPGQRYGFRVHGPWAPEHGHWCNPASCCSIRTPRRSTGSGTGTRRSSRITSATRRTRRTISTARRSSPRASSSTRSSTGATTGRPRTPWHKTVVYETHVKGFTSTHPDIPEELRGTYAGLAHPVAIEYLKHLGVTAVELLPVHQFVQDSHARRQGPAQLLGLQLDRLLRAAQRVRVGAASAASRSRSSSSWSRRCTRPASR